MVNLTISFAIEIHPAGPFNPLFKALSPHRYLVVDLISNKSVPTTRLVYSMSIYQTPRYSSIYCANAIVVVIK